MRRRVAVFEKLFGDAEKFVRQNSEQADHLIRTVYWVKELSPCPSKALIIAALMHDIERAFPEGRNPPKDELTVSWSDKECLRWHEDRSSQIASEFLKRHQVSSAFISQVIELIKVHEEGNGDEANILRDADSISFLEVVAPFFISQVPSLFTQQQVREKVDYMYQRITLVEAKRLGRLFYQRALKVLQTI